MSSLKNVPLFLVSSLVTIGLLTASPVIGQQPRTIRNPFFVPDTTEPAVGEPIRATAPSQLPQPLPAATFSAPREPSTPQLQSVQTPHVIQEMSSPVQPLGQPQHLEPIRVTENPYLSPGGVSSTSSPVIGAAGETMQASAEIPVGDDDSGLSVESLQAEIERLKSLATDNEDERTSQLELLQQAINWLENETECVSRIEQCETDIAIVPERLEEAKAELSATPAPPETVAPEDAGLPQLEQLLIDAEEQLTSAQNDLDELEKSANSKTLADAKAERTKKREAVAEQLDAATKELAALQNGGRQSAEPYRLLELKARVRSLQRQTEMLDAERRRHQSNSELLPLERDLAQRQVSVAEKTVTAWQDIVDAFRKAEVERQAAEARRIASEAHPAVRDVALRNAVLTESRNQLTSNMERVQKYLKTARNRLEAIQSDYKEVSDKVEVYGMTPTVGLLLRNRIEALPDTTLHKNRMAFCTDEMQAAQVALLDLETERSEIGDLDAAMEQVVEEIGKAADQFEPGYLDNLVRELFEGRRKYLDSLLRDYRSYHDDLADLELVTRDLLDRSAEYRSYIEEHVLWIPSTHRVGKSDLSDAKKAIGVVGNPIQLAKTGTDALDALRNNIVWIVLWGIAVAVAFAGRNYGRRQIPRLTKQVAFGDGLLFASTLQTAAWTLVMAAPWPLLLWAAGWCLARGTHTSTLTTGLARGLLAAAPVTFALLLVRRLCDKDGLARRHFEWNSDVVAALDRVAGRLLWIAGSLIVAVMAISAADHGAWADSLGRFVFVGGLLAVIVQLHRLLWPAGGELTKALSATPATWAYRLRHVWYAGAICWPAAIGVLAVWGYSYTANQLLLKSWWTLSLLLAVVVAQEFAAWALGVVWHRSERRRQQEAERAQRNRSSSSEDDEFGKIEEEISEDGHRQLTQFPRVAAAFTFVICGWFAWADVLPALQMLDRVELWHHTVTVTQEVVGADGSVALEKVPQEQPVTLGNALLAIGAMVAAILAARALPSVLEVAVLGRLPLDHGARNAIVVVARYVVTVTGFILAFRMIGIGWASVQWLAAAMTVGLGFGLQEIFANLVSGLIILFERPIRLGDLVTVAGTTGKVSKMQIRATTIVDLDRRELIVPNKSFITDNVINWTLSDPITRFIVPVGISYSCDPDKAHQLLLEVAEQNVHILNEPAPTAVFVGFGDSTLNLELRSFIAKREDYPHALHSVNLAIERAFRKANIEIAFPQQDIHIRSITSSAEPNPLVPEPPKEERPAPKEKPEPSKTTRRRSNVRKRTKPAA